MPRVLTIDQASIAGSEESVAKPAPEDPRLVQSYSISGREEENDSERLTFLLQFKSTSFKDRP